MTKRKHKYSGRKLSRGEPPNFSGQHLMHNKKLLYEIVDRAEVGGEDTVLEPGSRKGRFDDGAESTSQKGIGGRI